MCKLKGKQWAYKVHFIIYMGFGAKDVWLKNMLCLFCRTAAVQTVNKGDEEMLLIILCDFL